MALCSRMTSRVKRIHFPGGIKLAAVLSMFLTNMAYAEDAPQLPFHTATVSYSHGITYRVDYLSSSELRWTRLTGDEKGKSAEETYWVSKIRPGIWLVHWIESDGLSISQVLDITKHRVTTAVTVPAAPGSAKRATGEIDTGTLSVQ